MKNLLIICLISLSSSLNIGNETNHIASNENIDIVSQTNVSSIENEVIVFEKPFFEYYKSPNINEKRDKSIYLSQIKADPNNIIDTEEWFNNNNIKLNEYIVPNPFRYINGNVPYFIKRYYKDNRLVQATYDDQYIYALYNEMFGGGRYLVVYDIKTGEEKYTFDFIEYYFPENITNQLYTEQDINWAVINGNVLYVSNAHNTYANSSDNLNAFITAINLEDMKILWRSDALVSNSSNFCIIGDTIISGYGFTREEDYIYLIDKWTGEVYEKIDVKSAPEYFVIKEDILYVRTYNMDYQFNFN